MVGCKMKVELLEGSSEILQIKIEDVNSFGLKEEQSNQLNDLFVKVEVKTEHDVDVHLDRPEPNSSEDSLFESHPHEGDPTVSERKTMEALTNSTDTGQQNSSTETTKRTFYKPNTPNNEMVAQNNFQSNHKGEKSERPHKCTTCAKSFNWPFQFKMHMRLHNGERTYKCTNCGKSFTESSSLNMHMRVHNGVQPYKCTTCAKSFNQSSHLKCHMRIHNEVTKQQINMDKQKSLCDDAVTELLSSKRSPVIDEEKYRSIVEHLRDPKEKEDAHFKHWIKTKGFQLMDLPALKLKDVLVVPKSGSKQDGESRHLRVVHTGQIFDVVKQVHVKEMQHSGYKKCMDFIQRHYYGVTRSYIQTLCKSCPTCQLSQPQTTKPPLRPIVEGSFLSRVQMDLIDMRRCPDGSFQYIGHFMDHFTKYHILFPLASKTADEVSRMFTERVLAYLGPPRIFHSNNGREFVNQLMRALLTDWNKDVTFVNGRPRHSQSQGLIKRGNREVEKKIAALRADRGLTESDIHPWASWLPEIMYTLNTQKHETIKDSPYQLVFGCPPTSPLVASTNQTIIDEENLTEETTPESSPAHESSPAPESSPQSSPAPESSPQSSPAPESAPQSSPAHESSPAPESSPQSSPAPESSPQSSPAPESSPVPSVCSPRTARRRKAHQSTLDAAEKMAGHYNRRKRIKIADFSHGDIVSVLVPKIDRTATDLPRIPGEVIKVNGEKVKNYTIGTEFGVLATAFRGGDLEHHSGNVVIKTDPTLSLRAAAAKFNPCNKFTRSLCKCTTACMTGRCPCKKNKIACSTHCHGSRACMNNNPETEQTVEKSDQSNTKLNATLLTADDLLALDNNSWLNDNHVSQAMRLLKQSYPEVDGLQDSILQQSGSFDLPTHEYAQILHVQGNHWIAISTIGQDQDNVAIFDSQTRRI